MQNIHQTGLIVLPPSPEDYIAGGFTAVPDQVRIENGNWADYLPSKERQYSIGFDTMACTSFSALNVIETQVNFLVKEKILSDTQIARLRSLGFFDANGFFNASDRFLAIMSGTTSRGNDFKSVWESVRKNGLLPESDLPFGGTSFAEYHGASISPEMIIKAKEIFDVLTFQYEWVFFDGDPRFDVAAQKATREALAQAPVQIAIPLPGTHATMMFAMNPEVAFSTFDQYEPFIFIDAWEVPIHYALKGYVSVKNDEPFIFTKDLHLTSRDPEVAKLQEVLNRDPDTQIAKTGAGSPGQETVVFGQLTHNAVVKYQQKHGIRPTSGYVGTLTRKVLNGSDTQFSTPYVSKIIDWAEATKEHEGYYKPGEVDGYPNGSPSYRNKNPGNIRYVGQKRAIGRDKSNFCIFATYDDGYRELKDMLVRACSGKSTSYSPEMTLLQFYEKYAPSSDNNFPRNYALFVAKRIGVDITTKIKTLL